MSAADKDSLAPRPPGAGAAAGVVWITGAGGLLGSHLIRCSPQFCPGWRVAPLHRQELDLADFDSVARRFALDQPVCVVHCAGLTRVAACQADPPLAHLLNVAVTRHLCGLAERVPLVFLSTDLVFDGGRGGYAETDPVNPLSVYAETKVQAEQVVLANPRHTVVRLALNTGSSPSGDRSFTELMSHAWARGETLTLFTDEFRSPLPAAVTAQALWHVAGGNQPGLYHLGGAERLSRWEIGQFYRRLWAARLPQLECRMTPGRSSEAPGPPRPADTSLNSAKLQALLSFPLPKLTEWLSAHPEDA